MSDNRDPPDDLALLEAVAAALRAELGDAIEQQPGFRHPGEAGQVNRAFRATAAVLLHARRLDGERLTLSDALRRLARRRLEAGLLDAREVEHLLRLELNGRVDWMTYLILTPWTEIEYLLETRGPDA